MLKSIVSFALIVLFASSLSAQLDEYKYLVVPKKFLTFKEYNQYQSSTIIKHFMQQAGFNVIYDDNLPADVAANRCLALFVDVQDNSNMLKTKVAIALNDCKGTTVYITPEAQTKEKDLRKGYKGVISEASAYFSGLRHNYQPPNSSNDENASVQSPATMPVVAKDIKAATEETEVIGENAKQDTAVDNTMGETLNAIATKDGYLLIDGTDTIQYRLTKTAAEHVFHADKKGMKGIVYKKGDVWFFESEKEESKIIAELLISF